MDDKKLIDATGVVVETAGKVVAAVGALIIIIAERMKTS